MHGFCLTTDETSNTFPISKDKLGVKMMMNSVAFVKRKVILNFEINALPRMRPTMGVVCMQSPFFISRKG